jgi:radical SAM superfamily enzyme YgiQ (UPF0313 family)
MAGIVKARRRVLFVEPSAVEANVFSAFAGLPLLGPLYLGTLLEQAGYEVTVISENLLGRPLGMADLDADFLLLSCLTPTVERGYELASLFKRRNPQGKVLMGGPHVSFMTEEALRYADWVVRGEGEDIVADLLRYGSSAGVVEGRVLKDMDALPPVDWKLLANGDKLWLRPYMLSRGCPFGCNFCSVTAMFGRGYRTVSVERALEDISRIDRGEAFFYDDNFAANLRRTHQLVDGMLKLGKKFTWSAQVRADLARDGDLLDKMVRAGCNRVYVGLESVSDASLAEMNKSQTVDSIRQAVRSFHAHGIHIHGMFMFGADADDPRVLDATARFVRNERVDSVQFMILTPLPGTELYQRMEAEGRLLHNVWRYYDAMHVVFRPRGFSPFELQRHAVEVYADYYNLLRAMNDGLEAALGGLTRLVGFVPRYLGAPSLYNAALKLMGTRIVRQWSQANTGYLDYLRALENGNRVGFT